MASSETLSENDAAGNMEYDEEDNGAINEINFQDAASDDVLEYDDEEALDMNDALYD